MAETKADAVTALAAFAETYGTKYERAADCLTKDRDALLAFYDFPAEHWKHLRTTNPIESTFATVRHRTVRSKGCLSNKTALAMVFKLADGDQGPVGRSPGGCPPPSVTRRANARRAPVVSATEPDPRPAAGRSSRDSRGKHPDRSSYAGVVCGALS
jgi:hypothetical protein